MKAFKTWFCALTILVPLLCVAFAAPAQAVEINTTGGWAYEEDGLSKYQLVWIKGIGASTTAYSGCNATDATPSYIEASDNTLSCTLAGLLRVYLGNILAGEDTVNGLMKTSGGATRITTFSSVTSATTSLTALVPTGVKKFFAYMGGASETKAFDLTIYGNWQNSTTGGRPVCRIWVPSTASVTHIEATCPEVEGSFPYMYYTAEVYTSASATNLTLYALH